MYNAEVLSKFPVVQHFPFGSLFSFTPDPNARKIQATVHTASQPKASASATPRPQPALRDPLADTTTAMPSTARPGGAVGTAAPWARGAAGPGVPSGVNQPTKAPWASRTPAPPPPPPTTTMPGVGTAAPWARKKEDGAAGDGQQSTRAPWADRR